MALNLNLQIRPFPSSYLPQPRTATFRAIPCSSANQISIVHATAQTSDPTIIRRSANYHPSIWDFEFLQSLTSEYKRDVHVIRAKKLKENVRNMFNGEDMRSLELLELIDTLQKLGIGYLFEKEIKTSLEAITAENNIFGTSDGLHATALRFRLLRQHGYQISQDVFNGFKDGNGSFNASHSDDIKGLLSLYEASHLAVEGESILDEAKVFASGHLKNITQSIAPSLARQVSRSLELPLHWRMSRADARWYIEGGTGDYINQDVYELAKLDFNIVQATHQSELREMSRWWRDLGLGSNLQLSFARDRLVEHFLLSLGINCYPQFSCCRKGLTQVNSLATTIDDIYDVYGSLEELELFTDAIERWDINAIEQLPCYMKICFLALYNTVNEIVYVTLKEQGLDVTRYLTKSWADLCKAYLVEARYYYHKYTPTFKEYINNARMTISGHVVLLHAYVLLKQEITTDALKRLESYPDIMCWSSLIARLCNDLGTSTHELERGDVLKSVECYMHETGCSEESAREHIKLLLSETWKKMNKELLVTSIFPKTFMETAVDMARMAHFVYQYGDGHGIAYQETKARVISLLVEPIPLVKDTTHSASH